MRDQRNIHVSKGDALLHLQTGIQYEVASVDNENGRVELLMRVQFVRDRNSRNDSEIVLQGFFKIPNLNDEVENESRAKAVVEGATESTVRRLGHSALRFIKGKGLEKLDPNPTER